MMINTGRDIDGRIVDTKSIARDQGISKPPLDMGQGSSIKSTHYSGCSNARKSGHDIIFHGGARDQVS